MYSVERFYDGPLLPSPGSDFGAPRCAGGALVFTVFDSFKVRHSLLLLLPILILILILLILLLLRILTLRSSSPCSTRSMILRISAGIGFPDFSTRSCTPGRACTYAYMY